MLDGAFPACAEDLAPFDAGGRTAHEAAPATARAPIIFQAHKGAAAAARAACFDELRFGQLLRLAGVAERAAAGSAMAEEAESSVLCLANASTVTAIRDVHGRFGVNPAQIL